MKKNCTTLIFISMMSFFLISCEDSAELKQLKSVAADIRQKIASDFKKQDKAILKLPTPITYQSMTNEANQSNAEQEVQKKYINPLNAYPIKSYQFTGILSQGSQVWAYLLGPNNTIYQVKEGDVIGNSYGKITKISDNQVEVTEKSNDPKKPGRDKIIVLQLKD